MQLVWFRRDLRVSDNPALLAAARNGPVIGVFILSPQQWQDHDDAPIKIAFWLENLRQLQRGLDALNIPLLIRVTDIWRDIPETLLTLCRQHNVTHVHCNDEFGINEIGRDKQCAALLDENDIAFDVHPDRCFVPPGVIRNQSGAYFKVFSQFKKQYQDYLFNGAAYADGTPTKQEKTGIQSDDVPATIDYPDRDKADLSHWVIGEKAAQERLADFVAERVEMYDKTRDFPAKDGTSTLSPYLAAGVISVRQCMDAALAARQDIIDTNGIDTWINELIWRDFYNHILVGYPHVSRHRAFKPALNDLPWLHDDTLIDAWKYGRTGFPLIDAAMRQMLATGWMHNRLRMMTAMFLSKNLLTDWRIGEQWFMQHLIDGDLAANNGGWQWSASTGTDAVPYFRIFNPVTQSEKFDPDGDFIRTWIPELRDVPTRYIHEPHREPLFMAGSAYPKPIVDLKITRERAISFFKSHSVS